MMTKYENVNERKKITKAGKQGRWKRGGGGGQGPVLRAWFLTPKFFLVYFHMQPKFSCKCSPNLGSS